MDGVGTEFVHDSRDLSSSTASDIALEFGPDGLVRRWQHSASTDEPLGFEAYAGDDTPGAGTIYEMYADRMGSITAVIDTTTGAAVAEYSYDSFGTRTQYAGSLFQFYGYTGREEDPESGLTYYRARYYDSAAGVFVGADSYGFAGGDGNLYSYVRNDPYSYLDPSGHELALAKKKISPELASFMLLAAGSVSTTGNAINQVYGGTITGPLDDIMSGFDAVVLMMKPSDDGNTTGRNGERNNGSCGQGDKGPDPSWWLRHKQNLLTFMRAFSAAVSIGQYGMDAADDGQVDPDIGNIPRIGVEEQVKRTKDWFDLLDELKKSGDDDEGDEDDPDGC